MQSESGDLVERARHPQTLRDLPRWAHLRAREWAPILSPRNVVLSTVELARSVAGSRAYRVLNESELRATRRTDTVFVFGTGRSLLDIPSEEWQRIAGFETIAFSEFHRNSFVRVDYHLVNEVYDPAAYCRSIAANPNYADSIFAVQNGWMASMGNRIVGSRLLPDGARIFRYRRLARARSLPPAESFSAGLTHGWNSSFDAVNFALLLGWRRVVLVGIDMYDRQYAYLPPGQTHQGQGAAPESTPFRGVERTVELYGRWRAVAAERGVELSVYNPRSAVAAVLPVFEWEQSVPAPS